MSATDTKNKRTIKPLRQKIDLNIFKKILKENLNAQNEKLLIIGDRGYKGNVAAPIITHAYNLAAEDLGLKHETIYQNAKGRGDYADKIMIKKLYELPRKNIIIMNVSNRIGNLDYIGSSFRTFAKKKEHRFISSSSLGGIQNKNIHTFIEALDIDYKAIQKRTQKLQKKLDETKEIRVTTPAGTDITYNVEGIKSKGATGIYNKPGDGGNLPGSEAYIAPNGNKVNGTIVIDGSTRIKNKTILNKSLVKIEIKNNTIQKINNTPEAKQLKETLEWAHKKSKKPEGCWKIGELGIGLNEKAKIIGATILDEKTYGTAHFAIGSNYWFGGKIKSIIHLDQVVRNAKIYADGKQIKY